MRLSSSAQARASGVVRRRHHSEGKTMMKRILLTATSLMAIAAAAPVAQAADLTAPVYKAAVPAPVYNWTGFYIGANGGYAWGQQDPLNVITNRFDEISINFNGGVLGGTAGAQIQLGHVV